MSTEGWGGCRKLECGIWLLNMENKSVSRNHMPVRKYLNVLSQKYFIKEINNMTKNSRCKMNSFDFRGAFVT